MQQIPNTSKERGLEEKFKSLPFVRRQTRIRKRERSFETTGLKRRNTKQGSCVKETSELTVVFEAAPNPGRRNCRMQFYPSLDLEHQGKGKTETPDTYPAPQKRKTLSDSLKNTSPTRKEAPKDQRIEERQMKKLRM